MALAAIPCSFSLGCSGEGRGCVGKHACFEATGTGYVAGSAARRRSHLRSRFPAGARGIGRWREAHQEVRNPVLNLAGLYDLSGELCFTLPEVTSKTHRLHIYVEQYECGSFRRSPTSNPDRRRCSTHSCNELALPAAQPRTPCRRDTIQA
jgi:hypothetical protein